MKNLGIFILNLFILIKNGVYKSVNSLKLFISKGLTYLFLKKRPFQNVSYLLIFIIIFILFFSLTILLYQNSLNNYFYNDDLYLIRIYSHDELRTVLVGNWDPNYIGTYGFRPLTTYFNHFRAVLFGDSTFAHHFFLIFLSAICMSLFVILFRFFNIPYSILIISGLLTLTAKDYAFHIAFMSDGIHIFQGLLFTLSAISCLIYLKNSQKWKWIFLGISLILFFINLLTREDSILTGPVLVLLAGCYFYWILEPSKQKIKTLIIYIICLSSEILIYTLWYTLANIPSNFSSAQYHTLFNVNSILGMGKMFILTISMAGFKDGFDILYYFLAGVAIFLLFYTILTDLKTTTIFNRKPSFLSILLKKYFISHEVEKYIKIWRFSLLIFICTLIFCSVGFFLDRNNLTFFSRYFYSLFIILIIYAFYLTGYPYSKILISTLGLIIIIILFIQANNNVLMQQSFNEASITSIYDNAVMIYYYGEGGTGYHGENATIPVERQVYLKNYFETLGITSSNYDERINEINRALLNKSFNSLTLKKPFIPKVSSWDE